MSISGHPRAIIPFVTDLENKNLAALNPVKASLLRKPRIETVARELCFRVGM